MAPDYQRLGRGGDLTGMALKYQCAKALTIISMAAIVILAFASMFYTGHTDIQYAEDDDIAYSIPDHKSAADQPIEAGTGHHELPTTQGKCTLPSSLALPQSEDGSYTPTSPHYTILDILSAVPEQDYSKYCQGWRVLNSANPPYKYNLNGECGNWQNNYIALHKKRLEQLKALEAHNYGQLQVQDKPQYIVYKCIQVATNGNRGCGGLADRMSGMISTFFHALMTDKAYFAYWDGENPFSLDILFEKPYINWHYDMDTMEELFTNPPDDTYLTNEHVDLLNAKWATMESKIFPQGRTQNLSDLWPSSLVEVRSNRGYIIHTFESSDIYPAILHNMGLTPENAFGCMTDFLFKPTIGSRRFIDAYKNLLELDSIFSVGIQIRTGDNQIVNPQDDELTVESYSYFLTCANQLTEAYRKPHHKRVVYFLITDSAKLRDEMMALNDDPAMQLKYLGNEDARVLTTGLPIEHVEPNQVAKYINITEPIIETEEQKVAGINSAVIENWLLASTTYRVISPQGYGKLAAFHSNIDKVTYSMPRPDRKDKAPNCGNPHNAISFADLSRLWSLG
ncbi:hypothetical protein INT44_002724 [Umbelopsis vinacea]|uniref:Fucosyltransferase n=1 Tax=Umbelopsis vinacea TaxID=44442 RepID=A0A8H7ULU8_9FUNG|nr:hypothetical protein INT44_002724 [Umbelopsis vinacea]